MYSIAKFGAAAAFVLVYEKSSSQIVMSVMTDSSLLQMDNKHIDSTNLAGDWKNYLRLLKDSMHSRHTVPQCLMDATPMWTSCADYADYCTVAGIRNRAVNNNENGAHEDCLEHWVSFMQEYCPVICKKKKEIERLRVLKAKTKNSQQNISNAKGLIQTLPMNMIVEIDEGVTSKNSQDDNVNDQVPAEANEEQMAKVKDQLQQELQNWIVKDLENVKRITFYTKENQAFEFSLEFTEDDSQNPKVTEADAKNLYDQLLSEFQQRHLSNLVSKELFLKLVKEFKTARNIKEENEQRRLKTEKKQQ